MNKINALALKKDGRGVRKNFKKARREGATVWQTKLFPVVAVWRYLMS